MAYRALKLTFVKGELSPRLRSRMELPQYQQGLQYAENVFVQPQGPITKRAGFRYVAEVKDSSKDTRLLTFSFNESQSYVIEAGDQYFRFYTAQGQIETTPGSGVAYELATPYLEADIWDIRAYGTQYKDVLILLHPDYAPQVLTRFAHNLWTIEDVEFIDGPYLPEEDADVDPSATSGTSITLVATTSIFQVYGGATTPSHVGHLLRYQDPTSELWHWMEITSVVSGVTAVADMRGPAGFLDTSHVMASHAAGNVRLGALGPVTGYPAAGAFYEQRLFLGGVPFRPMSIWSSQTGLDLFQVFAPGTADDDGLDFTIDGPADPVRWIVNHRQLAVGSVGSEFASNTQMTPSNLRMGKQSRHGSKNVQAIVADRSVLMVSKSGRKIIELAYDYTSDAWLGRDVTVLAEHITRGGIKEIVYQQDPDQIIWALREDGILLSCTYWPDEGDTGGIVAWCRQSTGASGLFQSIAVIPGQVEARDELWAIVQRTIDGSTVQYVEFLESQWGEWDGAAEMEDAFYLDSALTYTGPARTAITDLTTATAPIVTSASHGLTSGVRCLIYGVAGSLGPYVNGPWQVATSPAPTTNTFSLEFAQTADWPAYTSGGYVIKEVTKLSGLGHLEGCTVTVLGDGFNLGETVVSGASIVLDDLMGVAKAHVGLGYNALLQTMPVEFNRQGGSLGRFKRLKRLTLRVHNTVGAEYSLDGDTYYEIPYLRVGDPMS